MHRFLLCAFSDYFKNMMYGKFAESKAQVIKIGNVSHQTMMHVLEYVYTGQIEKVDEVSLVHIAKAANMFDMQYLHNLCLAVLEKEDLYNDLNIVLLVRTALEHHVLQIVGKMVELDAAAVFGDSLLLSLMGVEHMMNLLKGNSISMEEHEVFETCWKWATLHAAEKR